MRAVGSWVDAYRRAHKFLVQETLFFESCDRERIRLPDIGYIDMLLTPSIVINIELVKYFLFSDLELKKKSVFAIVVTLNYSQAVLKQVHKVNKVNLRVKRSLGQTINHGKMIKQL